ncbi:hypothetical protein BJ742DRAFT_787737 [Cladochytrium replicatum]|nr:hypothetical protein BJ742DRAFT_787737 [Cladochytrium replicatum]
MLILVIPLLIALKELNLKSCHLWAICVCTSVKFPRSHWKLQEPFRNLCSESIKCKHPKSSDVDHHCRALLFVGRVKVGSSAIFGSEVFNILISACNT